MSNNNITEDEETPGAEKEYMGRTSKEWYDFLPSLGSIALIVIGALNLDNCDLISILPTYCIVAGGINLVIAVIKIIWRTDRVTIPPPVLLSEGRGEEGTELEPLGVPKVHPMKHVTSILGISIIGIAIWGAVLTFPKVGEYWSSDGAAQCDAAVFISGLVSAAVTILIFGIVLIGAIGMALRAKVRSSKQDSTMPPQESNV
jgi:uncharacterized membrane protein